MAAAVATTIRLWGEGEAEEVDRGEEVSLCAIAVCILLLGCCVSYCFLYREDGFMTECVFGEEVGFVVVGRRCYCYFCWIVE